MAGTTTALCSSFKQEALQGGYCFNAITTSITGTTANAAFTISSMSALTGLAVGMTCTGSNIAAGSVIASIDSTTAVTLSKAATGTNATLTFTADSFKIALVKASPAGTFGAASTNYSNLSTDELGTGGGYTATGQLLINATPNLTNPVTAAAASFTSPSWTSATFTCSGAMIYNTSNRVGTTGRSVSIHDFGGNQQVSAGTFTLTSPTQDGTTGLIRIS